MTEHRVSCFDRRADGNLGITQLVEPPNPNITCPLHHNCVLLLSENCEDLFPEEKSRAGFTESHKHSLALFFITLPPKSLCLHEEAGCIVCHGFTLLLLFKREYFMSTKRLQNS